MPNTAVKPLYAESTRLETVREDRELPVKRKGLHRKMQAFLSRVATRDKKTHDWGYEYFTTPYPFWIFFIYSSSLLVKSSRYLGLTWAFSRRMLERMVWVSPAM